MRTLTKIILPALAATLSIGAIAPAQAATPWRQASQMHADRYEGSRLAQLRSDIRDLRSDIDRAAARRVISQREAYGLRRDANQIQRLYSSYARGGLNARETAILRSKVDRVHVALRAEAHDRNGHRR